MTLQHSCDRGLSETALALDPFRHLVLPFPASESEHHAMPKPRGYFAKQKPFHGTTVVEIAVPSGKLIASDDLRSTPHFDVDAPLSINYGAGIDAWARLFAEKAQVAYAFVGNSCPSISRQEDGTLTVVELGFNQEFDEPVQEGNEVVVASICTDMWAVMLTDYQHWLSHGGPEVDAANEPFAIDNKYSVIDVVPGLYRWTAHSSNDAFDMNREGRIEYARLELIRAY